MSGFSGIEGDTRLFPSLEKGGVSHLRASSLPLLRERGEGGPSQNAFAQLFNEANSKNASGHNAWRLIETAPASAGEESAALGFTIAFARRAMKDGLLVFAAPQAALAELGVPYAEGLAQFGIDLDAFLIAATRTQIDALWAAEQALKLPEAFVLCTIAPAKKPLDLIATRRLFLAAKKNRSACALLRLDAARASAAELRFEVSSAPGESAYGLGAPAFDVRLTRNRAGPAGGAARLQWSAHEYAFREIARPLDGAPLSVPADRPAEAPWRRTG